jgi:DNA-binding NtrC family response regulator
MSRPSQPRCLIAEDQTLIALSLEAYLEDAGFEVVGPFGTNRDAVDWLRHAQPTVAIIDLVLKDGPCVRLAQELRTARIPFAIYSGLPPTPQLPPELQDVPWIEKPVSRSTLVQVLEEMKSAAPEDFPANWVQFAEENAS